MTPRWKRPLVLASAAIVGLLPAACGSNDSNKSTTTTAAKAPATPLNETVKEYSISLDTATVPAGRIRLTVTNQGTIEHETVAFKTDLPETDLPLTNGSVDEKGAGITHMDPEAEAVPVGGSKTITLNLAAGRYVLLCNLPGHYKLGMHSVLTVQ